MRVWVKARLLAQWLWPPSHTCEPQRAPTGLGACGMGGTSRSHTACPSPAETHGKTWWQTVLYQESQDKAFAADIAGMALPQVHP